MPNERKTEIKVKEKTPVRVMNLNDFPAMQKTGTQIAYLSPIVIIVRELHITVT